MGPDLVVRYSSDFSLSIQLLSVQAYEVALPDYRFRFQVRILHPTGEFTYMATDIFFDPRAFRDFAQQLDAISKGRAEYAGFADLGQMVEFSLGVRERRAMASIRIREYQPNAEQTSLSASFPVDYDLFVNSLRHKVIAFLEEIEGNKPD